MEKKKSNKISWSTIYSLGLVPAILVWGLAPSLKENVIVLTSINVGIIWIIFSRLYLHFFKGCGIIGWITGWSMIFGGITKAFLLLFGYYNIPIVLFWAPCMAVILYLFEHRNIHPPFCYQCILKRGGIRERHLLGDFSRYETHYIVRLILIGSILVTMLSWILFAFGVERQSRAGNYFYFYFPLGLSIAIIIFEIIRRLLIQQLIESHEKKCKRYINDKTNNPDMDYFFTVIRIMVIGQEKIYLIENKGDEIEFNSGKGFDIPIHRYTDYCTTQEEEEQKARQIIREELQIEKPDLRHISSAIAEDSWRRVGHYVLFISDEDQNKLNRYNGRWYTIEEITRLFHSNRLYPLFKEIYARFYTIVNTARTYYSNGKRRYPIRGYKPSFTLHRIDLLDIELDDPVWLYVSRHNDDRLLYRIDKWIRKILGKKCSSSNCCDA